MPKWLIGVLSAVGTTLVTASLTWFVSRTNDDHELVRQISPVRIESDHETLRQLWWKDQYINGQIPGAPVTAPKK